MPEELRTIGRLDGFSTLFRFRLRVPGQAADPGDLSPQLTAYFVTFNEYEPESGGESVSVAITLIVWLPETSELVSSW